MIPSLQLFKALQGTWKLTRTIHDRHQANPFQSIPNTIHFTGSASWSYFNDQPGSSLHLKNLQKVLQICKYEEWLVPVHNPTLVNSSQMYYYAITTDSPMKIKKYFKDGRLFEIISISKDEMEDNSETYHLCGRDEYRGNYDFSQIYGKNPQIKIQHMGKGPEKDYTMMSVYCQ